MGKTRIIRGHFSKRGFVPSEPLPPIEGPAELIVHTQSPPSDIEKLFDLFGKAPELLSGEEIDRQIRQERESWE